MHQILTQVIEFFGGFSYTSVFFLMALESSIIPVPSEAVMIPAGYLAATGKMNLWLALLAGTFGSIMGATVNYFIIGRLIGKPFIEKYGKYFFINHKKYLEAEVLFMKNDKLYTFLGRFIPVVRHLISIPAGIFRMNFSVFLMLTGLGAGLWCLILLLVGYYFGEGALHLISHYREEASIVVIVGIILGGIWFIRKKK